VLALDHLQLVELFLKEPLLCFAGQRDALETGVRDDDGVPVSRRNPAKKLLPVLGLEIFLARNQDVRAGIQRQQLRRELAKHVVGDGEHWFAGKAEPFEFHRGSDHGVGLSRADDVCQERVGRLENAPHARFLVSVELDYPACAWERQVVTVECADARVVEHVVVKPTEPFPPRIVRPHPFFEAFLDALLLLAGSLGGLGVDDRFLVLIEVVDRRRFEVQGIFNEFKRRVTVRAPIGRVGGRSPGFPIPREMPSAECMDMADLHAGGDVEQLLGELLHVLGWQPGSAQPHVNLRGIQISRLHRLQSLDVFEEARVRHRGSVRNDQFLADIAGEVVVVGFPLVRLRIQEDHAFQVGQEFLRRLIEQRRHVVEVHAATLVQGHEQRLLGGTDGFNWLPVMDRSLGEDGGFGRSLGLIVVVLE